MVAPEWTTRFQDRVRAGLAHPIYGYPLRPVFALAWLLWWMLKVAFLIVFFIPIALYAIVLLCAISDEPIINRPDWFNWPWARRDVVIEE